MDTQATATGGYTLPRYAFIPHPALQQLAYGRVMEPAPIGVPSASFVAPAPLQRPYPTPDTPAVYGVRSYQVKSSPG